MVRQRNAAGRFLSLDLPVKEIVELYLGGTSENALAKQYGVNRGTIRERLIAAGVDPRGIREAQLLRWNQMLPEQREAQIRAAHDAARGRKASKEERIQKAISRQLSHKPSTLAAKLFDIFKLNGLEAIPEFPLDTYNLDFAFPQLKIAIEVDGGKWHSSPAKSSFDRGKEVLLSLWGWRLIRVQIDEGRIILSTKGEGEDLCRILKVICSDPSLWREKGMIAR